MHSVILFSFLISLVLNSGLFLIAYMHKSDKLTDLSYALSFMVVTCSAYVSVTGYNSVLFGMIVLWALRIGGFLLFRVIKAGKDGQMV